MTSSGGPPERSTRAPSVDALARSVANVGLPHPLAVDAARAAIAAGDPTSASTRAHEIARRLLGPVVNATGVLVHTNLGRAPLAVEQAAEYTTLEFEVASGRRGSRQDHAGWLIARASGAEAALVVNNGASAVMLVLAALARGRGVAVSRGELIQLGGGFRLPDVMVESGARLVEVGTTNRTSVRDYERAVADPDSDVAMAMKIHQSNYRIVGFTESAGVSDLAELGVPVVFDLGSGLLDARVPWLQGRPPDWLSDEPAARQTLEAGADLVIFSGDKLLGGPQCGIIAGQADLVAKCAEHSLYRAVRPGSLVLGALQDVALHYLDGSAGELPLWQMASMSVDDLQARANAITSNHSLPHFVSAGACTSVTGGGTAPAATVPSWGFTMRGDRVDDLRSAGPVPVITRVHDNRTLCDLRTVLPHHDTNLGVALASLR